MKMVILIDIDDTIFDFSRCSFEAFSNSLIDLNVKFEKSLYEYFIYR
ncbi:hypothetical protein HV819_01675 [Anaerococcus sp. AGMB00486]|uniref:HAD family hydrolase n=1 Tax=Anaerococcus faecalis TaxID=2742993 RepID=A0ABX2N7R2_9FIRM|nr:hypothetical protein [Anaerococcus faecalis]NVF10726.1 hypothetical protein [Anaerococcus faecalis]